MITVKFVFCKNIYEFGMVQKKETHNDFDGLCFETLLRPLRFSESLVRVSLLFGQLQL